MEHAKLSLKRVWLAGAIVLGGAVAAQAKDADQALIERGQYVATAGDCAACHTAPRSQGQDFAGGYPIASPLGTIWSTNITPSRQYGIGDYSFEDFARAVRQGVAKDGTHLYPAMPYDAYAGVTDNDMKALYAYFMHGVKPVDQPPAHVTALPFPFNLRFSMAFWNLIYAGGKPFTPDASLTDKQNRGKYLSDTLGHCASCHSPRGVLMGPVSGQYLKGGDVGPWHAPDITGNPATGVGGWTNDEIVAYLKTGAVHGKAQAGGPMAEAVENSFQHMTDADLNAIAAYLKTVDLKTGDTKAVGATGGARAAAADRAAHGAPKSDEAQIRGLFQQNSHNSLKTGAELYSGYCASCHQPDGAGSDNQRYPSLYHNSVTGASAATNLIAAILYGVDRDAGGYHALMPHFNKESYVAELSNQEVADIANYVLTTWGNPQAATVTPAEVETARTGGPVPLLAKVQPYIPAIILGAVVLALLILGGIALVWRARSARKPT